MLGKISAGVTALRVGLEVLREVYELVQIVEDADVEDGEKHGKEKKEAVLNLIAAVYDAGDNYLGMPVSKEFVLDLADKAIEVFVGFLNVVGRFRSKS